MNPLTELINNVKSADWSSANQNFADIMQSKVANAITAMRSQVFKENTDQKKTSN